MTSLSRDARFFVEGVTKVLRDDSRTDTMLPKVAAALHKITASAKAESIARVESAVTLSVREKAEVSRLLSRLVSHQVKLAPRVDKSLIAGMKIQMGDWVVDTSIAGQIEAMKEQILL